MSNRWTAKEHNQECQCAICAMEADGLSAEQAMQKYQEWEQSTLTEHGWIAHMVFDDLTCPYGFNAHTHGLQENYGHLDLQLVLFVDRTITRAILEHLVNRVKNGERFQEGQEVQMKDMRVKMIAARENDRDVLRIIMPDPQWQLEQDKMVTEFSWQYETRQVSTKRPQD